uniref:tyrosine-type recombinase/integrase n=2 Tax=Escherichia coli TaxID=562 RepID=UPI001FCE3A8E
EKRVFLVILFTSFSGSLVSRIPGAVHTWASWLIQSGVPLSVLQEMGGWESIEMVRRYAHLAPNHLTEHARKIDDIFGDNVPNMSHCGIMEDIKKA